MKYGDQPLTIARNLNTWNLQAWRQVLQLEKRYRLLVGPFADPNAAAAGMSPSRDGPDCSRWCASHGIVATREERARFARRKIPFGDAVAMHQRFLAACPDSRNPRALGI